MKESYTEHLICEILNRKYIGNSKYRVSNAFIFNWESDFFIQKENGYAYEFEVKISRADFFHDKKKIDKHLILETGKYNHKHRQGYICEIEKKTKWNDVFKEIIVDFRPNKFYYVVPKGMITVSEVPSYAGLMYVDELNQVETIKEAPFIHKNKLKYENVLCNKFYHYWLSAKNIVQLQKNEIQRLQDKLTQ